MTISIRCLLLQTNKICLEVNNNMYYYCIAVVNNVPHKIKPHSTEKQERSPCSLS